MTRQRWELVSVAAVLLLSVLAYAGKVQGWHAGFQFSTTTSVILLLLTVASLIWLLVLTIKGKLISRRIVFMYVAIGTSLPLFMSISQTIPITDEVRSVYDAMVTLAPGSKVLISFDYDPASAPELQPMAEAFIAECFERDYKIIMMGLWPQGPQQANLAIDKVLEREEFQGKTFQYGIDYVNLGFQTGNEFVIQRMGSSFQSMFKTDYRGTPYEDIPLVKNITNFDGIDFSFNLSAGFPGTVEWVQVAVDRYGLVVAAGNTAVQAPTMYPYLGQNGQGGQLVGLLGGMSGGAEFEKLTGRPAKANKYMLSQSLAHLIVIAFIIIGNVAFFMGGRKSVLHK